jgi:anti-anti-sigma factor
MSGSNARYRAPFEIQVERRGETAFIRLRGEFDLASEKEFKDQLRLAGLGELRELVFDLTELSFIDSTGLRMILEQWNNSRRDGPDLSILPVTGQVQRVFAVAGLDEVLPFRDGKPSH